MNAAWNAESGLYSVFKRRDGSRKSVEVDSNPSLATRHATRHDVEKLSEPSTEDGRHSSDKKSEAGGTSSSTTAVINLAKTTIGAGIMAMPKSIQLLGLLFGSIYIILLSWIIYCSLAILVQASHYTGNRTYKGAVKVLMGRRWAQLLQIIILMANAGSMTACLILTADILVGGEDSPDGGLFRMWGISSRPLESAGGQAIPQPEMMIEQRWFVLLVLLVCFLLPLCMQEKMSSLRFSSILGLFLAGSFALITVCLGLIATIRGQVHELNIFPKMDCPAPLNILHLHHHHHPPPPPPPPPTSLQKVEALFDTLLQNPTSPPPSPPPDLVMHGLHNQWDSSDDVRAFITWRGFTDSGQHRGREALEASLGHKHFDLQRFEHFDGSKLTGMCKRHHFVALASDLIDASAVCLGSFVCHYSIHPIMNEMRDRAPGTMLGVIATSNTAALAAYLATAWGGYFAFSNNTSENLLKNFEVPDLVKLLVSEHLSAALSMFVRLGYAVVMMTTYPLINFSFRSRVTELVEDMCGGAVPGHHHKSVMHRLVLTLMTLSGTYVLAVIVPDIWTVMSFVGATGSTFMSFLMPAALALKMDPNGQRTQLVAGILLVLGGTLVIGGVGNILFMS